MKKLIITFLSLLLLVQTAWADFSPQKWQLRKAITSQDIISDKTFVELVFDDEVFKNSKTDLSDIRVVSDRGEEPYVLVTEAPKVSREIHPVRILDKGFIKGELTTFIADLEEEGIFHNHLRIITNSKNFRRQVEVEGGADKVTWLALEPNARIYDFTIGATLTSPGSKVQETSVSYPETIFRFLRVKIFDKGEEPLNILGAETSREIAIAAKEVNYEGKIESQTEDSAKKVSLVTFDLGVRGLPTNKILLKTKDLNFNREIALEGSNDLSSWSIVFFRDVIFSFDTPKFKGSKLLISYPESGFRYFRLTIFNKDNRPIVIDQASFSGFLRKLVFEYDPNLSHWLYYGNPKTRYPEYDLKNYFAYLDSAARQAIALGKEKENPAYEPEKEPGKPFTERYPNLLLGILIVAVIVIGLLALRLFRKTKVE